MRNSLKALLFRRGMGIKYLMADLFSIPRAAGAISGTQTDSPSGVAPVTRFGFDTENKMQIANGKLEFLGGKTVPSWGDPGYWLPSINRQPGIVLKTKNFQRTSNNLGPMIGFDTGGQSSITNSSSVYINNLTLTQYDGSGGINIWAGITLNVDFDLYQVLRAVGSCTMIKGGAFANVMLVWISSVRNDATIFPALLGNAVTATFDEFRLSDTLFLPVPLLSHGFDLVISPSDGEGHAEDIGGIGGGGDGVILRHSGTWSVSAGKAINTPVMIGASVVVNGNMELGDPPSNWTAVSSAVLSSAVDERTGGSGTKSMAIANGIAAAGGASQLMNWTVGKWVRATAWGKFVTNSPRMILATAGYTHLSGQASHSNSNWQQLTATARMTDLGRVWVLGVNGAIGLECRFDDVEVREMPISSLFALSKLNTPNVMADSNIILSAGTQAGLVLKSDCSFAAKIINPSNYSAGATTINLKEVSKAITTSDTLTIAGNTYTISSVGALVGELQTVTLSLGLAGGVADDYPLGVNYATPNLVLVYIDGSNLRTDKCVNGTWSNVSTAAVAYNTNALLRVWVDGSAFRCYYNNVFFIQSIIADASIINNCWQGAFNSFEGNQLDNLLFYATGSEGQYNFLNAY